MDKLVSEADEGISQEALAPSPSPPTKQKLIVLAQRVDDNKAYGERRDGLDQRWAHLLHQAHLLAVPLPNYPPSLPAILERLKPDGILLTGGNTPVAYGGQAPERDQTDERLIAYALSKRIPLLGVCRGMQSIALYYGGTLKPVTGHLAQRHALLPQKQTVSNSDRISLPLAQEVNSYHDWAIATLGAELEALAQASDGTIEALRHPKQPLYGIMWHPERETPFQPKDLALLQRVFHN